MAYAPGAASSTVAPTAPDAEGAAEWVRQQWASFVGLEPELQELLQRAAVAREAALAAGDASAAADGREIIDDVAALLRLHHRVVTRVQELGSWIGLGATAIPPAVALAFAAVAAAMVYLMNRLGLQRQLVDGLEAGTLTRAELDALGDVGGRPGDYLRPVLDVGKLVLWAAIAFVGLRALELGRGWTENPELVVIENPPGPERLSGDVVQVRYIHDDDGRAYYHDFGGDVELWTHPDGSLELVHPRRRLWRDF